MFASVAMLFGVGLGVSALDTSAAVEVAPVEKAEAATATTVYYAASSSTVGSYTVKCNVNRQGDASNWAQYDMLKTEYKYEGYDVYKATFTDLYDGLGKLQFQLYNGSSWVSQIEPISSWTGVSNYNGKLIKHGDNTNWRSFREISADSYFYWTDKDSHDFTNAYFFGEYQPLAWPGLSLSSCCVSSVLNYKGQGKLYKIPCPSSGSYKVILNNNNNVKTVDMIITPTKLSYTWYSYESGGTYFYDYNCNTDSAAADLISRVETLRNSVTTSGSIIEYSICGISADQCANLWNEYYSMSSNNKSNVDESYTYTYAGAYDGKVKPAETNVYFSAIMLQLKAIAVAGGKTVSGSNRVPLFGIGDESTTTTITVIIVTVIALGAVGGFFLIKRKKKLD